MTLRLSFTENPDPDDVQVLTSGIKAYAKQEKGFESLDFFACFIHDSDNTIVGGCSGGTLYGGLHIDNLWVSERIRHKGWGTKLMHSALKYGQKKGCAFATVNTMDWEAIEFYQKLGFKLEFERHGFQKNSVFYFLRKEFQESANTSVYNELTSAHQDLKPLDGKEECQIRFFDEIDKVTEKRMTKDLIAYETSHGIDVNYQRFSLVISNEKEEIFGVINAYTAFAEIYVDDIWVENSYRGKGYGRRLLSFLENHFKGQGFNNINLVTSAFQAPEFYKKCGFKAEFTRINKSNPKLSKTFFVKFFDEDSETQGLLKNLS